MQDTDPKASPATSDPAAPDSGPSSPALITARPLLPRRALLLATGAAALGALTGPASRQARAGDIKPDYNDLNYDARDVSNHFGRDDDTD